MAFSTLNSSHLDSENREFYRDALSILQQTKIPVLVGGNAALERYTGIVYPTQDLDIFTRPEDVSRILDQFAQAGYVTQRIVPHWLAQVYRGENRVNVICGSANGLIRVDGHWFDWGIPDEIDSIPVLFCAPEEMIGLKAYEMECDRFQGADIAHLILAYGDRLDWHRLLRHFRDHWRVLLSHLTLFGFIYPGERQQIPQWVMNQLCQQLVLETNNLGIDENLCQGSLLSDRQYQVDIQEWGYQDARLVPHGNLTESDLNTNLTESDRINWDWIESLPEGIDSSCSGFQ